MSNNWKRVRRVLHWTIAAAFVVMVLTGLTLLVPALSGLAAGGWTRLVHKIAAVLLVAAPLIYAVMNRDAVRLWFRDAAVWRRPQQEDRRVVHIWQRWHKLIISAGFIMFVVTGSIQWFFKGIVPSSVFNVSLLVHDIVFFSALLILLYHIYFELVWWLWRRKYCRQCGSADCADECTVNAISTVNDNMAERNMSICNGCRLCMKACQREGYYIKPVRTKKTDTGTVD
ncbi:MAG: cytochrome b/b6 domain-containing protein [Dehalococcoidia bacterium]|jgi:cytochrome b subunit of formate dehydrogenase